MKNKNLRPENARLLAFLAPHFPEINDLRVKRIRDGSLKGSWRVYAPNVRWSEAYAQKFIDLGFLNLWGDPDLKHAGNGGLFSIFVRGHNELV